MPSDTPISLRCKIPDGGHVAQTTLNWPENKQNKQSPTFWFWNHLLLLLLRSPQLGCPDPVLAILRAFEVENERFASHSFPLIITQMHTGTFAAWWRRKRNRSGLRPSDISQKLTFSHTLFGQIFVMFAFLYHARSLPCGLGDYLASMFCFFFSRTPWFLWTACIDKNVALVVVWGWWIIISWWFVLFPPRFHSVPHCTGISDLVDQYVCQRLLSESFIQAAW